jgi:biopolymer transport protein TolQ
MTMFENVVFLPAQIQVSGAFGSDIIQMVIHAGPVVKFVLSILCLFSITSWAIIFMKWRLFRRARNENGLFLELFWESTALNKIYGHSDQYDFSPVAQLFRAAYSEIMRLGRIQNPGGTKNGGAPTMPMLDVVERTLKKTVLDQTNTLERAISFLATTGNTTPFIGLFGTVWGIMESFRGIGLRGAANLAVVAPGISEALIATAAGLAAAIPAVVAYNYFSSKLSVLRNEMDLFSADFLSLVERQIVRKSAGSKEE